MKTKFMFILAAIGLFLSACSPKVTPEVQKRNLDNLEPWIKSQQFHIDLTTAYPQNTNATQQVANKLLIPTGNSAARINIVDQRATLVVKNDSTMAQMPFYGERRMGANYNQIDQGISFESVLKDYTYKRENDKFVITFETKDDSDNLDFTIDVYSTSSVRVFVASAMRTTMSYDGTIKALKTEEE